MSHLLPLAKTTIIVSTIILCIAWATVALRFYARWITKLGFAADDWWILAGILITTMTGTTYLYGVIQDPDGGANMDRDSPTFDFAPRVTYMKASYSIAMLYITLISTVKISILLMYRRIFSVYFFRQQSLILGGIVGLWWLSGTIATAVYCVPLEQYWVGPSAGGHCFNYNIFWMVMGATEVLIDTAILLLPVRMVYPLQLTLQTKLFVMGIFMLGGFVVITGICRTIYGYMPGSTTVDYEHGELWSCIHVGTAIICACLPALRPLFGIRNRCVASFRARFQGSPSPPNVEFRRVDCQSSWTGKHDYDGPPNTNDTFSQLGKSLTQDEHPHRVSTERIMVEETVNVEWSRLSPTWSHEDVGLTALPPVHLGKPFCV